jgi:hypothetical protein
MEEGDAVSNQAKLQPLVNFLVSAINTAITNGGTPSGWLGTFDSEAPVQADSTSSPPPYAVLTIQRNATVGFFGDDTNYDVTYEVAIVTLRKTGPAYIRNIADKLIAMHNKNLTGFISVTTDCTQLDAAISITQDTYIIKSLWRAFGDSQLS